MKRPLEDLTQVGGPLGPHLRPHADVSHHVSRALPGEGGRIVVSLDVASISFVKLVLRRLAGDSTGVDGVAVHREKVDAVTDEGFGPVADLPGGTGMDRSVVEIIEECALGLSPQP